jgi:hypothetical protein
MVMLREVVDHAQTDISAAETFRLAESRLIQCLQRFRMIVLVRALDSGLVPRDPSTAACIRPKHTTKPLSSPVHQGNHVKSSELNTKARF